MVRLGNHETIQLLGPVLPSSLGQTKCDRLDCLYVIATTDAAYYNIRP